MDRAEIAERVLGVVEKFVTDNHISCSEAIYQVDRVIENAYAFIDELCTLAGFFGFEDEE